jgi:hypothetical protein
MQFPSFVADSVRFELIAFCARGPFVLVFGFGGALLFRFELASSGQTIEAETDTAS